MNEKLTKFDNLLNTLEKITRTVDRLSRYIEEDLSTTTATEDTRSANFDDHVMMVFRVKQLMARNNEAMRTFDNSIERVTRGLDTWIANDLDYYGQWNGMGELELDTDEVTK